MTGREPFCDTVRAVTGDDVRRRRAAGARPLPGIERHPPMKKVTSLLAAATVLALAACGGGTPPSKPVEKNTQSAAPGSIKSPTDNLREKMSASNDAAADSKKK